jgi:hypothetical protein
VNALDELLKKIESDLHLFRRDLKGVLTPLREALETYERSVEEEAIVGYCRDHSLKPPVLSGVSRANAAERVRKAFQTVADFREVMPLAPPALTQPLPKTPEVLAKPADMSEVDQAFRAKFGNLTRSVSQGKLLVFGAFAGRTKSLPEPLNAVTEWIDTAQEGNRLVSNAVKRMRLGSIFAVIICDQAIQHQHAEPVVAEARAQGIPVGYAGKGGNGALARALEVLETALA